MNEKKTACVPIFHNTMLHFRNNALLMHINRCELSWDRVGHSLLFFTQPVHTCPWVALAVHGKHLTAPDKSSTKSESSGWQRSKPPWRSQTSAGCHLYPRGAHIRDQQEDPPGLRLGHAILSKQHGRIKTELTNRNAYFLSAQSRFGQSISKNSLYTLCTMN